MDLELNFRDSKNLYLEIHDSSNVIFLKWSYKQYHEISNVKSYNNDIIILKKYF
jgi:hypothetical protein